MSLQIFRDRSGPLGRTLAALTEGGLVVLALAVTFVVLAVGGAILKRFGVHP